MNWAKTVIIFQAVMTLIIGIAFFIQVLQLDNLKISKLNVGFQSGVTIDGETPKIDVINIKQRYSTASYLLLIISMIELIVVGRFMR